MPMVSQLYEWLAAGPAPDCDRALAVALDHAEGVFFRRLCAVAVKRDQSLADAALIGVFGRLPPELQERFTGHPERMGAAVADALRMPLPTVRRQALAVLEAHPLPQLAVVLSDALRDRTGDVCEPAAALLATMTATLLDEYGPVPPGPRWRPRPEVEFARRQLGRALLEAAQSFEVHWRLEPLRAALWMARDLGEGLWAILNNRRSRCRDVVLEKLHKWDEPRMAGFYLAALQQPDWAGPVEVLLRRWSERAHVRALLAHSDLLEDAALRARLAQIRDPEWFRNVDQFVLGLPPRERVALPRWVCATALSDGERCALLSRWLHRSCPLLRRASAYALAALDVADVPRRLEEIAVGGDAVATFARWWLRGRALGVARRGAARRRPTPDPGAAGETAELTLLWQLTRRVPLRESGPLLGLLREHFALWRAGVLARLRSPDARDRLLAVQVLAVDRLAPPHKRELQQLLHDPVPAIRDVARTLLQSIARLETSGAWTPAGGVPAAATGPAVVTTSHRSVEEVRAALLAYLSELLATDARRPLAADTLQRIAALVGEYHAVVRAAAGTPTGAEVAAW